MSFIPYILYLVLIAFHQVVFRDATSILGITINLPAIIILSVALNKSEFIACWFAFFGAIIMCAGTPLVMGMQALLLVILSLILCHVRERLNLDSMVTKLSLLMVGILLHNIFSIVINQSVEFVYQLWRFALPGTIYTGIAAYLLYGLSSSALFGRRSRGF
jgi:hypothetical protein